MRFGKRTTAHENSIFRGGSYDFRTLIIRN
ncbi:hypothetical protein U27_02991 [Candidatus Vecturithrix granuli]|uniref:Uncharacterized protein n=1 Tax=Vecturithrix granuli TaxID=1499967 RepID=A0A081BUM4_VECG1|nr:hypothetical protein U27_02991 [Candidatus Vecturithrix granuli]